MLIVDTDILSMFAKADALDMLIEFGGQEQIGMTPAIADEISTPLHYGYEFPLHVLSRISVVPMNKSVAECALQLQTTASHLGRGEREAIAFCKIEGACFATNDAAARTFALSQGITVISLQALLRALWTTGLRSETEIRVILERIKETDYLKVSEEVEQEIFGQDDME